MDSRAALVMRLIGPIFRARERHGAGMPMHWDEDLRDAITDIKNRACLDDVSTDMVLEILTIVQMLFVEFVDTAHSQASVRDKPIVEILTVRGWAESAYGVYGSKAALRDPRRLTTKPHRYIELVFEMPGGLSSQWVTVRDTDNHVREKIEKSELWEERDGRWRMKEPEESLDG